MLFCRQVLTFILNIEPRGISLSDAVVDHPDPIYGEGEAPAGGVRHPDFVKGVHHQNLERDARHPTLAEDVHHLRG